MTGFVGCAIFLSLLAAMLAIYAPDGTNKVGLGWAVAATYAVVICYCLGVESCGAPFYTEIFPTHIRAKGVCWTLFINSLVNIVYLEAAPTALQNIGWKFLLVSPPGSQKGGSRWMNPDINVPISYSSASWRLALDSTGTGSLKPKVFL